MKKNAHRTNTTPRPSPTQNQVPEQLIEQQPQNEPEKPSLEKGNYLIEVVSEGNVVKKMAVANRELKITKLADGFTITLNK